ncbi:probable protein phosphatase 2C 65 [Arachis stenosperma]|uniref:probable protein phosphatase 2C 65 n=1 Tax=Arachis ipaensis TaxID=130454 RepID=UPI0007AFD362|nr:probable protein phosphatase 2C 65 [Arachis ipaensis]XP_029146944.1 probable protein phosphatase 2C 65 [Arachis hypogaea]XP_057745462.1 probable protein phosphatase 2C 65 [Arachis stenosperma]
MGNACTCQVSIGRKVYDADDSDSNNSNDYLPYRYGHCGAKVMLSGSSKFVSMYSQKGQKEVNQDAMTVWENFTGEKDMIFCGVFDGHGPQGHKYAQTICNNLPSKLSTSIKMSQQISKSQLGLDINGDENQNMPCVSWEGSFLKSFSEMDRDLAQNVYIGSFSGGSTAVTIVKQENQLIIGNLGDSRAILCTKTDDNFRIPIQLTVDLKPNIPSEASRITKCGGRIFPSKDDPSGINRIWMAEEDCPGLAMTRSFGDFCLKDYGLISVPDVIYRRINKQDEFVVLASDGIWDVLTNEEVINIISSARKRSEAAKTLVKHALQAWKVKCPNAAVDDCTAICLFLNN